MNAVLGKFAKAVPPPVLNNFTKVVLQVLPPLLIKLLNSSNPFIAPPGVANLSGVMVLPSLNVKPRLWCRLTSSSNFHSIVIRQAIDNSRRKIFPFSTQLGWAIAADCEASRSQNAQQSTPKIVGREQIKFSELTAAQLAALLSENIQAFRQMSRSRRNFYGTTVFYLLLQPPNSQFSDVKSFYFKNNNRSITHKPIFL